MSITLAGVALAGLIASAIGGIANTGINHIQRATDRQHDKDMVDYSIEKQTEADRELRQTYYQDNVASMEEAGINPAMALTNSGSIGAGTPNISANAGNSGKIGTSFDIGGVLNGIANVARVYNNDSDHTNNLSLTQAVGMLANVAKILK